MKQRKTSSLTLIAYLLLHCQKMLVEESLMRELIIRNIATMAKAAKE